MHYLLNPYVHIVENRLFPGTIQYGIFHQLTGELTQPSEGVRTLLLAAKLGSRIAFNHEYFNPLDEDAIQIRKLIHNEFLISDDSDPLASFVDQYVVRPRQNPAVAYRSEEGETILVRTSMSHRTYSPKRGEVPVVLKETLSQVAAEVFVLADGTKSLREIFKAKGGTSDANPFVEPGFKEAIDFLTDPERQLIKFTSENQDLDNPYKPFNTVPRNLYHSSRWQDQAEGTIFDFHVEGIEDARWEFDFIEPTINHSFRFPSEALGGLDYGSRFCLATLNLDVVPLLAKTDNLKVLEVGGGTGSFARSFLRHARELRTATGNEVRLNYYIMDLSPALISNQKEMLSGFSVEHFQQDATKLNLPGHAFDLILANEVIADFPTADVQRFRDEAEGRSGEGTMRWHGEGAYYMEKYDLSDDGAPQSFLINAGTFHFIERVWEHLSPGGTLILTEYGSASRYAVPSYHLNHAEYSIHFGHLEACAKKVGFDCRILMLKEFLGIVDDVLMLDGQEEHLLCLNHVLGKYGISLPYALISKTEFEQRLAGVGDRIGLTGVTFSPLRSGFHFGPNFQEFMVLIMSKPQ